MPAAAARAAASSSPSSVEEVRQLANDMLGMTLVTHQTGPQGRMVKRVYVEDGCNIARELYLGAVIDRATSRVTFMASTEGGVEIEEVAAKHPEKIIKVAIDPVTGFMPFHGRQLAFGLGLKGKEVGKAVAFMQGLYQCVVERDASLVEINPLVVTADGDIVALDAKMNFDSNALYRQPKVVELRDLDEEDPHEIEASRHELNYIKLDGNIGCMVNGAGLAMATMDIIKLYGGEPGELPRRRRRRHQGAGDRGLQAAALATPRSRACWSTSSAASCAAT